MPPDGTDLDGVLSDLDEVLSDDDGVLSQAEALTFREVALRRGRWHRTLSKVYRECYWTSMEELRVRYREYCWVFGRSPYREDEEELDGDGNLLDGPSRDNYPSNGRAGMVDDVNRCLFGGCKAKAMALTRFCHPHILSDSKQKLYKGCAYVVKSSPTGGIRCGKPVLRSTVPSLCSLHFQKVVKHATRALKKAGFNIPSSTRAAPKLHVIIKELVHEIQNKRRATQKAASDGFEIGESKC